MVEKITKIANWIILIVSVAVLFYILNNIFNVSNNVLKFYYFTIKRESFLIFYYCLYAAGALMNLIRNKSGNKVLLFAAIGFVLSEIGDYLFIGSYFVSTYLVYIAANILVIFCAREDINWRKVILFVIVNSGIIYTMYQIFDIEFML